MDCPNSQLPANIPESSRPRSQSLCKTRTFRPVEGFLLKRKRDEPAAKCAPNVVFTTLQEQRNMRHVGNSTSPTGGFRLSTANRLAETENKWEELKLKLSPRDRSCESRHQVFPTYAAVRKLRTQDGYMADPRNKSSDSIDPPRNKRTFSAAVVKKEPGRHKSPDSSRIEVTKRNFCVMSRFCKAITEQPRDFRGKKPRLGNEDALIKMALSIKNGLQGRASPAPTKKRENKNKNDSTEENSDIKVSYFGMSALTPRVGIQNKFVTTKQNYYSPRNENRVAEFRYIKNARIDLNQVIRGLSNQPHKPNNSIDTEEGPEEDHDVPGRKIPQETAKPKLLSLHTSRPISRDHSYSTSSSNKNANNKTPTPVLERTGTQRNLTDSTNKLPSGVQKTRAANSSSKKLPPSAQKKSSKDGFARGTRKKLEPGTRTVMKYKPRKGNMSNRANTPSDGVSLTH